MHKIALVFLATVLWSGWTSGKELSELEVLTSRPTRCTYERAFDMYGAHCVGLKLTRIPNLKGGIEILDLTDNKLKELESDTFSSQTSIRFLYLADNSIFSIHEDTFKYLTSLQTLDLSMNVIQTLPPTILNLPSLRKLYLSGNPLDNLNAEVNALSKPIKAPLEQLDLSNCRLFHLPNFGVLPQLRFYNVSYNRLKSLEAEHFAGMCNLGKVDLTESTKTMELCRTRQAVMWMQQRQVHMVLADYSDLNSDEFYNCPDKDISAEINATYHNCKNEFLQVQSVKASRSRWLTIGGGLAGFLVAFILLLYLVHRRNVVQTKKALNKHTPIATTQGDKQNNVALLDNAS